MPFGLLQVLFQTQHVVPQRLVFSGDLVVAHPRLETVLALEGYFLQLGPRTWHRTRVENARPVPLRLDCLVRRAAFRVREQRLRELLCRSLDQVGFLRDGLLLHVRLFGIKDFLHDFLVIIFARRAGLETSEKAKFLR